jgi:hypothetical protein
MCVFLSAVDTKLTYMPMLAALVSTLLYEPVLDCAYAAFVICILLGFATRFVRMSRDK